MIAPAEPFGPSAVGVTLEPFYLDGCAGSLFCLLLAPAKLAVPVGTFLYLPPFAEEANQSRRMAVLQGRRLAARGWAVLLLDPYGTGDSAGAFGEARWEIWLDDASKAASWLARRWPEAPVVPWGLRLGALLATDLAAREPKRFSRLLFWQPILRGDRFMVQFLRLRVAAAMAAGEKESVQQLRERLAGGELIEVAGYELAPSLVASIDELKLAEIQQSLAACSINWLDVSSPPTGANTGSARPRSPSSLPAPSSVALTTMTVVGPPFWSIQENVLAPNLLDATDACFA